MENTSASNLTVVENHDIMDESNSKGENQMSIKDRVDSVNADKVKNINELDKAKKKVAENEGNSDDSAIVRQIIDAIDIRLFSNNVNLMYFWNDTLKIYSPMIEVQDYVKAISLGLSRIRKTNLKNKKRIDSLIYLLQSEVSILGRYVEMSKREIIAFNGFHGCDDVHYLEFHLDGKIEILEPSRELRVLRHYDWTLNEKNIYSEEGKEYYMPKCKPTGLFKTNFFEFLPEDDGFALTLQEYLGDTLRIGSSQVAPVLKGPGQNLKGVIIDILLGVHGKNAFAYDLSSNTNFNNAKTLGKFLAICDEVKAKINDDDYKKMNGQSFMNIDRKGLSSLDYKYLGKMVVALNRMFTTKDQGFSLERRVTIFNLDRIVPETMALDDFSDKLLNGGKYKDYYGDIKDNGVGQKSEIVEWMLEGCARVCSRGKLLKDDALPECLRNTKKEVMKQMMPIKQFFDAFNIKAAEKGSVIKEDVWNLWRKFCQDNGYKGEGSAQTFAQDFKQRFETDFGNGSLKYSKKDGKHSYKISMSDKPVVDEKEERETKKFDEPMALETVSSEDVFGKYEPEVKVKPEVKKEVVFDNVIDEMMSEATKVINKDVLSEVNQIRAHIEIMERLKDDPAYAHKRETVLNSLNNAKAKLDSIS